MPIPNYYKATNAAYQLLVRRRIFSIRTDVFAIAQKLPNCKVLSYKEAITKYGYSRQYLLSESEDGFSVKLGDKTIILYNEEKTKRRIRFTIAHEIGHYILGHNEEKNPVFESEANCFARNLLCPVPLVATLCIKTISEYMSAFDVSEDMARYAIKNFKSDVYYLVKEWRDAFMERFDIFMMGFETYEGFIAYLMA